MANTPVPRYYEIKKALSEEIERSEIDSSTPFITTREVCSRYGVSTTTAVRAINELVREGLLNRERGRGTFIADRSRLTSGSRGDGSDSRVVACILAGFQGRHNSEMLSGMESVCREAGYRLLLFDSGDSGEAEALNLERAVEAGAGGFILFPAEGTSNTARVDTLRKQGQPIVMVDRYYPSVATDVVVPDNFFIGHKLAEYLIQGGHRHIATLWGETDCTSVQDRLTGYRQALREHDLPIVPELTSLLSYQSLGRKRREELLTSWLGSSYRPTAFLCANGYVMALLASDLIHLGVSISKEAVLAGMDDVGPYDLLPLATVAAILPSREMGIHAMRLLLDRMRNREETIAARHVVLPVEISMKDSKPVHLHAVAAKGA